MWHLFYGKQFEFSPKDGAEYCLLFEGIDTVADIYVNGKFAAHTENMLMTHEIALKAEMLKEGKTRFLFISCLLPYGQENTITICWSGD